MVVNLFQARAVAGEPEHAMRLQRRRIIIPADLRAGFAKSMNALSRSIDGLQQSAFQLAKRQPGLADNVPARKSNADPEQVSHDGVSVPGAGDQLVQIALRVLKETPTRDQEVLPRSYLLDEQPEEIQRAVGITETHFRRVKSLAKSRFDELRKVEQRLSGQDESGAEVKQRVTAPMPTRDRRDVRKRQGSNA